jgi:hypothetical protein
VGPRDRPHLTPQRLPPPFADLATAVNNLSLRLAEAGRRAEGLTAIQDAVAIRRRLADANPAAYKPDLAGSLNNLSNRLAEPAGRKGPSVPVRKPLDSAGTTLNNLLRAAQKSAPYRLWVPTQRALTRHSSTRHPRPDQPAQFRGSGTPGSVERGLMPTGSAPTSPGRHAVGVSSV